MNAALYEFVTTANIPVAYACEVGVYLPDTSNVLGWINDGIRTTLVECDPLIVTVLRQRFSTNTHVRIEAVAVAIHVKRVAIQHEPGPVFSLRTKDQ